MKPMNWVRTNGLPRPSEPEDRSVGLREHDALHVQRAGLDDDADHGEHERQLVGDQLAGGPQAADSEYLLADAQPAISMPSTDSDDTARAKKMPVSRLAKHGVGPERHDDVDEERR